MNVFSGDKRTTCSCVKLSLEKGLTEKVVIDVALVYSDCVGCGYPPEKEKECRRYFPTDTRTSDIVDPFDSFTYRFRRGLDGLKSFGKLQHRSYAPSRPKILVPIRGYTDSQGHECTGISCEDCNGHGAGCRCNEISYVAKVNICDDCRPRFGQSEDHVADVELGACTYRDFINAIRFHLSPKVKSASRDTFTIES